VHHSKIDRRMAEMGQLRQLQPARIRSALPQSSDTRGALWHVAFGRVEDGRGSLGHAATLRFPSPLIEPDVRISRIRLSNWLRREAHEQITYRKRHRAV
jgi:hypothetical protein